MIVNTQAFILKVNPQGETSAILHCYSKDFGKLILIAKGARNPKSPFKGLTEPFSLINIHFNEKKDRAYQFLSQAEYQASFTHLKANPEAVLYGSIILEILYKEPETEGNTDLFNLIMDVFSSMENGTPAYIAHWYFILNFLAIEGLELNTYYCSHCEEKMESGYFLPRRGYIQCPNCRDKFTINWELDRKILSLLRELMTKNIETIPGILDKDIDKELVNRILWNTLATRFDTCRTLRSVEILKKIL